jgi:hypothetical protein
MKVEAEGYYGEAMKTTKPEGVSSVFVVERGPK